MCREHVDILARVHPELSKPTSRIRTEKGWRRCDRGRWRESTIQRSRDKNNRRIALVGHRREGSRVSGRRDGLAWIVVGKTLRVRSAELERLISIRGDTDVHGTLEIVFFLLLTAPRPRKTLNIATPLRSRSSQFVAPVFKLTPCKYTLKSSTYKERGTPLS